MTLGSSTRRPPDHARDSKHQARSWLSPRRGVSARAPEWASWDLKASGREDGIVDRHLTGPESGVRGREHLEDQSQGEIGVDAAVTDVLHVGAAIRREGVKESIRGSIERQRRRAETLAKFSIESRGRLSPDAVDIRFAVAVE